MILVHTSHLHNISFASHFDSCTHCRSSLHSQSVHCTAMWVWGCGSSDGECDQICPRADQALGGRRKRTEAKIQSLHFHANCFNGGDHVLILILRIKWPAWWRFERCVTEIVPVLILCVEAVTLSWRLKGEREPLRGLTDQVLMLLTASTAPIHWSLAKKPSQVGIKTINMFIEAGSWGGSRCQITVQIQSRLEVEILPTMTFLNYDLWKTITISWQFLEVWQCGSDRESFAELDPSAKLNSSNSTELVTGININFEPISSHTTQYRKTSSLSKKVCVKSVLTYSSKKNSSHEKADLIKGWLSLVWRGRKFLFFKSFRNGQTHSQPSLF